MECLKLKEAKSSPNERAGHALVTAGVCDNERTFPSGSLNQAARRLREWVAEHAGGSKHLTSLRPKIGTRYVREYRGKLHEVTVLESGFEYEGSTYRSLTEIAKVITGSQCSGPAFFGLKRRVRRVAA